MRFKTLLYALSVLFIFSACDEDDNSPQLSRGDIAISTTIPNPDGMTGSSYLQLTESFSKKTLDNSRAEQIPYATGVIKVDDDIFVMPGFNSNILKKFGRNENKELIQTGSISLPTLSLPYQMVKASNDKVYLAFWGGGKIWIINPITMEKTGEIDVSSYARGGDSNPDPSAMLIRDGKLYVGLYQAVGGFYPSQDYPYADVLIINTATDAVEKMITTEGNTDLEATGLSTATRPVDNNTIFVDENNDIYVVCIGGFGVTPGHKTGILKIKNGDSDFDPSYKFIVADSSVTGESEKIGYIANVKYMGDGKLYANANFPAYYDPVNPSEYFDRTVWPVVIDIYNKTITKLPFTKRSNAFATLSEYKGKLIYGLITDSDQGFFTYDTTTGMASSSPVITTTGFPGFFGSFDD